MAASPVEEGFRSLDPSARPLAGPPSYNGSYGSLESAPAHALFRKALCIKIVNQSCPESCPHLLRNLNANSAISLQNDFALIPGPEEKASELPRDLTANDTRSHSSSRGLVRKF
jgi:hypothetical protein